MVVEYTVVGVLVVDGGNAALCVALTAYEQGASVFLLEATPREWHRENSKHTRSLRYIHDTPQDVLVGSYPREEFQQDLWHVTEGSANEALMRLVTHISSQCRDWMRQHGVNFQPPLSGALRVAHANAFFMGGGKALVSAYYRSAEKLGVQIRYNTPVQVLKLHNGEFVAALAGEERITAKSCVLAASGLEFNREWLREAWGENAHGRWPTDNFLIRGTRSNQGVLLKFMIDTSVDIAGDPSQLHCVIVDVRASLYDDGIYTRVGCVSPGIVVSRDAGRFYDGGEDFQPRRYATWGRPATQQPGQVGYSIVDSKAIGHFMPPAFPGTQASTLAEPAFRLELDAEHFIRAVTEYNNACQPGQFGHTILDNYAIKDLLPAKTYQARPLDQPPYYGYTLWPGITFTYFGLKVNEHAVVRFAELPSRNLFVAREMMAGNALGKDYTAGVGMSIGTTFDRIAGKEAALVARKETRHEVV